MRLLVSARDTGAAAHMAEIVPALQATGDVELVLIADEPALSVLRASGLRPLVFNGGSIDAKDAAGAEKLRNAARQIIADVKPDALLVGLSGPGLGLDEALLAEARALPSYAVQDYPGWVVEGFGAKPTTFFVTDTLAAEMTAARLQGCNTVVIGSAKHAAYAKLDTLALRAAGRARLGGSGPHIGFYGQPAWFLPGYERAVSAFARALSTVTGAEFFYRPHPKETADDRERMAAILRQEGVSPRLDPNNSVEQSLCAADLVVTCFSSCGADLIHLQKQSPQPLGTVLYLFTEADIQAHHAAHAGSRVPPLATLELAFLTTESAALATDLRHALNPATAYTYWERTRKLLPDPTTAPDVILTTIRQGLTQSHRDRNREQGRDMTDVLKGNFTPKNKVKVDTDKKETLEERFERTAKARLGGSIAYVAKKRVAWNDDDKK